MKEWSRSGSCLPTGERPGRVMLGESWLLFLTVLVVLCQQTAAQPLSPLHYAAFYKHTYNIKWLLTRPTPTVQSDNVERVVFSGVSLQELLVILCFDLVE